MKRLQLLQWFLQGRSLLILSVMTISSLGGGCAANNDAPAAATEATPPSLWKLSPGDRLVYRLKYTSDSFADLQALYGSSAVAKQKPARRKTSAPSLFRVTVDSKAVMTAIKRDGANTIASYSFPNAEITVEGDMGSMINTDLIQSELAQATFCEVDADGRIGSLIFDAAQSSATQKFSRVLLGLMQFTRPENADPNHWQSDEDDLSGDYLAEYNAAEAVERKAAQGPSIPRTFHKTKLEYFPPAAEDDREIPETPKTIVPDADLDVKFDPDKGYVESISGSETQTILINNKVVGGAKNEIQLTFLSEEKASTGELASAVQNYQNRSLASPAIALSSSPSEHEQLTAIYQAHLGDDSLATIKNMIDAAQQGSPGIDDAKLESKVKALIFLQPETCIELGRVLQSSGPNSPTGQLLKGAFEAVGNAEAQQAMIEALKTSRNDAADANSLITALGAIRVPTQAAQETVEEIAWGDPGSPLASVAQDQLGVMAHNLKKRSPQRAADIVKHAVEKLSTIEGSEDQLIVLLGNAGVDSALPILATFFVDPSADVRGHAVLALRFIDGDQADEMLARALSTDPSESVRRQAVNALEFRNISRANFDAQKDVLLSSNSNSLRGAVMRNLWRGHEAFPEVVDLVKEIATKDSSKDVRREATRLLANS